MAVVPQQLRTGKEQPTFFRFLQINASTHAVRHNRDHGLQSHHPSSNDLDCGFRLAEVLVLAGAG